MFVLPFLVRWYGVYITEGHIFMIVLGLWFTIISFVHTTNDYHLGYPCIEGCIKGKGNDVHLLHLIKNKLMSTNDNLSPRIHLKCRNYKMMMRYEWVKEWPNKTPEVRKLVSLGFTLSSLNCLEFSMLNIRMLCIIFNIVHAVFRSCCFACNWFLRWNWKMRSRDFDIVLISIGHYLKRRSLPWSSSFRK